MTPCDRCMAIAPDSRLHTVKVGRFTEWKICDDCYEKLKQWKKDGEICSQRQI